MWRYCAYLILWLRLARPFSLPGWKVVDVMSLYKRVRVESACSV